MTIKQISIFLENQPGHLSKMCRTLADAKIDILALSLADTQQFGIVRLIVENWESAKAVLEKAGFIVKANDVVAVNVDDTPGGMADILDIIDNSGVNIEYTYAFSSHRGREAMLVFRFDDTAKAEAALAKAGHSAEFGDVFQGN